MKPRIAIIGAGIGGITLAHALRKHATVAVFEKSRGLGGRMATRREGEFSFDHGTQYFTARSRPFREFLTPLREKGIVAPWEGQVVTLARGKPEAERIWFEPHYVAVPGMNALCKALGDGIDIQTQTEIAAIIRTNAGWELVDTKSTRSVFEWVIITAPAPQTLNLIGEFLPKEHPIRTTRLQACHAVMLGLNDAWSKSWIGAKFEDSPLGWVSANHTKPGRSSTATSLVLHATNSWSDAHVEDARDTVQSMLLKEFTELAGVDASNPAYVSTHRWRYALVENPSKSGFYCDPKQKLAAVGDWSVTSRIEEVWFAATELAEKLRNSL